MIFQFVQLTRLISALRLCALCETRELEDKNVKREECGDLEMNLGNIKVKKDTEKYLNVKKRIIIYNTSAFKAKN